MFVLSPREQERKLCAWVSRPLCRFWVFSSPSFVEKTWGKEKIPTTAKKNSLQLRGDKQRKWGNRVKSQREESPPVAKIEEEEVQPQNPFGEG